MTVRQLKEYLESQDQDINVYFYQYDENKLLGVEEEEISVETVHRSLLDGKIRIVPPSKVDSVEQTKKALIFT
jgi:arginine deiminase